ncbi:MAG: hypothetical protein QXU82_01320 [Candidatus Aenigmatarchaeota archaeon]
MNIKDRLLAAYVKSTDSEDARVRALMDSERPYYEFGRVCGAKHMKDPSKIIEDAASASIAKKMFGEYCRRRGEKFIDPKEIMSVTGKKDAIGERMLELQNGLASDYLAAIADFSLGYSSAVGETAYDSVVQAFDFSVQVLNSFSNGFLKFPTVNNYADRFLKMLDNRDVEGMIDLYGMHWKAIDEKLPDAGKLVGFLRAIREPKKSDRQA